MRIIAGSYRSRTLEAPPGLSTRPTSDRLRETLFNVLAPRIETAARGAAFLDLYAGSGAVGLEALSRGAALVTFVERAPAGPEDLARQPGAPGNRRRISHSCRQRGCVSAIRKQIQSKTRTLRSSVSRPTLRRGAGVRGCAWAAGRGGLPDSGAGRARCRRAPAQDRPRRAVRRPETDPSARTGRRCAQLFCSLIHGSEQASNGLR